MYFYLISIVPFFLFFTTIHHLPSWASEVRLVLVLFCQELSYFLGHILNNFVHNTTFTFKTLFTMDFKRIQCWPIEAKAKESDSISLFDLPDLAIDCILSRLEPKELCNMARVCSSLREQCRSDYVWERHMRQKWGKVIGEKAKNEWEFFSSLRKNEALEYGVQRSTNSKKWLGILSCGPISWIKSKLSPSKLNNGCLIDDSIMSWYLALESGRFWFPAQVYNREHGHVGFMMSCYDAELSYDRQTDSFQARYLPHGRRAIVTEEGVDWARIRASPVDTAAHELHASECLQSLRPGDHIEIQWRRNKDFPYGWWYGIVGHLESCSGNEHFCHCQQNETVVLEFNQYTVGSRWRRYNVSRKDHMEEGNETDGFYAGIRKLNSEDEISTWKSLWPVDNME